MRRLGTLILAPLLALGLILLQAPAAHAFGSEVLGCAFDSYAWTANSCEGGGDSSVNDTVYFSPHNLSGTYTTSWTVTRNGVTASRCSSTVTYNCISAGCTASAIACDVIVHSNIKYANTWVASLKLTQSGQTRTISATALVDQDTSICITC